MIISDFDGVLCDSVQECLLVTYNAYQRLNAPTCQRILDIELIDQAVQHRFRALRPYLKGAEDFVPILLTIEHNAPIQSQQDFDAFRALHQDNLLSYQEAFYAERDYLQQHETPLWLQLNPLFPGIRELLSRQPSFESIHILTTKRQQDVSAVFAHQGIAFPPDHITYVNADGKPQKLLDLLDQYHVSAPETRYFEDQVEFLVASAQQQIPSYLVEWGYVSAEQKTRAQQQSIPVIPLEQFCEIWQTGSQSGTYTP